MGRAYGPEVMGPIGEGLLSTRIQPADATHGALPRAAGVLAFTGAAHGLKNRNVIRSDSPTTSNFACSLCGPSRSGGRRCTMARPSRRLVQQDHSAAVASMPAARARGCAGSAFCSTRCRPMLDGLRRMPLLFGGVT